MKRTAIIVGILSMAVWSAAQSTGAAPQTPAAAGQPTSGQGTAAQGTPAQGTSAQTTPAQGAGAQPAVKRPPQAKTQPEFDAYTAAAANKDPAALEKAANDFAAKYSDSELRIMLYKTDLLLYQNSNNAEKTDEIGRKVLAIDPDDPGALTLVSDVIAQRTRDTDLDREQRYDEGMKMAQKALTTVDTDIQVPAGTPQATVDAYKAGLRAQAYSTMGSIEFNRSNFPAAREDFQKAVDADLGHPFAQDILHLALAIDRLATLDSDQSRQQKLYADALEVANRAVGLTQENTPVGGWARREHDRLLQLTGHSLPPAQPSTTPQVQPAPTPPQGQPLNK